MSAPKFPWHVADTPGYDPSVAMIHDPDGNLVATLPRSHAAAMVTFLNAHVEISTLLAYGLNWTELILRPVAEQSFGGVDKLHLQISTTTEHGTPPATISLEEYDLRLTALLSTLGILQPADVPDPASTVQ